MPSRAPILNSLALAGLRCERGDRTLFEDLSAEIKAGQCVHVIGANGSGKTSLLRILAGLNQPDTGSLSWNGHAISEAYFDRSIYLGHKDALKNELTAVENLRFYQHLDSIEKQSGKEELLDDCLNQMNILQCADLLAQQLSFGQKRRLAFARVLLRPYDLWILDEPFTGVDTDGRELIEERCHRHLEAGGMIVLTHHSSLADSTLASYVRKIGL